MVLASLKWILKKIFDPQNVLAPLRALLKLVLGRDLLKSDPRASMHPETLSKMETLWRLSTPVTPQGPPSFIQKALGILRTILLLALGVAAGFGLLLFKARKDHQLKDLHERERLAKLQRLKEMQAIWAAHHKSKQQLKLQETVELLRDVREVSVEDAVIPEEQEGSSCESDYEIRSEQTEQGARFDAELEVNEANFNMIKSSGVFKPKHVNRRQAQVTNKWKKSEEDVDWLQM